MIVRDAMSRSPVTVAPRTSLRDAALQMRRQNVGILPILEDGRAVGIVTDRDIILRGMADGKDSRGTSVKDIMTEDVISCRDTENLEAACNLMELHQIRRVVVTDKTGEVVGLLSLDDVARTTRHGRLSAVVLHEIANKQAAGGT